MSKPSNPMQACLDVSLLTQLTEVMELRENTSPDPQRVAAIKELKNIRNLLIHGRDSIDLDVARNAMNSVLGHLLLLEQSSLGSPGARRLRRRTSARTICDILNRAETTPAEAFLDDAASTTKPQGGVGLLLPATAANPAASMGQDHDSTAPPRLITSPRSALSKEESLKRRKLLAHGAAVMFGTAILGSDRGQWLSDPTQTPEPEHISMTDVK